MQNRTEQVEPPPTGDCDEKPAEWVAFESLVQKVVTAPKGEVVKAIEEARTERKKRANERKGQGK